MQLSNGAIKVKSSTAAALATKAEEHQNESVDLETFDLSAFVAPSPSAVAVRGAGKEIRIPEVEKFLSESAELFALGEKYEVDIVERGHKALYELLASIYSLSLRIEQNPHRDKILDAIRIELKDTREITSIASAKIRLRSWSRMPSASASEARAPGLTPKMNRPFDR